MGRTTGGKWSEGKVRSLILPMFSLPCLLSSEDIQKTFSVLGVFSCRLPPCLAGRESSLNHHQGGLPLHWASFWFQKGGNGPGPQSMLTPNIAVADFPSCFNQALVLPPWEPWTVHREIPAAFRLRYRFPVIGGIRSEHHIQDCLLFYFS